MPKALSRSDLELANAAILSAHRLIHHALTEKRITAATLASLSANFMEAAHRLNSLASSPFLAVEPAAHELPEPDVPGSVVGSLCSECGLPRAECVCA